MIESLYHNKVSYLSKKKKIIPVGLYFSMIVTCFLLLSCSISISSTNPIFAIYQKENNTLLFSWPISEIETLSYYEKMKIENQIVDFKIKNMSNLLVDEVTMQNVQKIEIESPKSFLDQQVLKVYLLDRKEKIILKIKKIIWKGK
ncbi:MAG: hypothetical protein HFH86_00475 [Bacilli bacterium]|jgi:hypothetical protein|nr:hypothetical protein [Bacilli bacterium]